MCISHLLHRHLFDLWFCMQAFLPCEIVGKTYCILNTLYRYIIIIVIIHNKTLFIILIKVWLIYISYHACYIVKFNMDLKTFDNVLLYHYNLVFHIRFTSKMEGSFVQHLRRGHKNELDISILHIHPSRLRVRNKYWHKYWVGKWSGCMS